mmetsp:Transcript_5683/g.13314  ORF Transcript_5683/g.13314 Transcript_5683/m.13314 type:complete len:303 (+) Transcript_5683:143-1051(+)
MRSSTNVLAQAPFHSFFELLRHGDPATGNEGPQLLARSICLGDSIEALQHRPFRHRQEINKIVQDIDALLDSKHRRLLDVVQWRDWRHSDLVTLGQLAWPKEVQHHLHGLHSHLLGLLGADKRAHGCQRRGAVDLLQQPYRPQNVSCKGETEGGELRCGAAQLHARLVEVLCFLLTVQQRREALHRRKQQVLLPLCLQRSNIQCAHRSFANLGVGIGQVGGNDAHAAGLEHLTSTLGIVTRVPEQAQGLPLCVGVLFRSDCRYFGILGHSIQKGNELCYQTDAKEITHAVVGVHGDRRQGVE